MNLLLLRRALTDLLDEHPDDTTLFENAFLKLLDEWRPDTAEEELANDTDRLAEFLSDYVEASTAMDAMGSEIKKFVSENYTPGYFWPGDHTDSGKLERAKRDGE